MIEIIAFIILLSLIMLPFLGLLSLVALSPFAWLYVLVLGLLFIIQIKIPKKIRNITIVALSLGIIMTWISLVVSYQNFPDIHSLSLSKPIATGGFPITAFEYPSGALGNNVPPVDSWGLFYLNLFFWIVVGTSVATIFRRHLNKKMSYIFFIASFIISIYGLGYILLKFD